MSRLQQQSLVSNFFGCSDHCFKRHILSCKTVGQTHSTDRPLNAAQSLNSCWLDSCLNHVHRDNDYQLWTQLLSFPTTMHPNWPLNVLQGLGNQREGFADLTPEVGLGQWQAQVPLSDAPGLDHVGVTVAYCVHDGFLTALDCLQPQLGNGGWGWGNNCYSHDHQDRVQQYFFFHIASNFNNYSEDSATFSAIWDILVFP